MNRFASDKAMDQISTLLIDKHRAEIIADEEKGSINEIHTHGKKKQIKARHRKDYRETEMPANTGIVRKDIEDMQLNKWIQVGGHWECPRCEFGVEKITGTIDGVYARYRFCPNCGTYLD